MLLLPAAGRPALPTVNQTLEGIAQLSQGFFFSRPRYRMLWRTLMVSSKCAEFPVFSSRLDGSLKGKTDFEVANDMALFSDCWTLRLIRLPRIPEAHDGNSNDSKATGTKQ